MKNRVAVIIPYYTNELRHEEKISLKNTLSTLNRRDIYYVAPKGLEITTSVSENLQTIFFDERYFAGREGYNDLMLNPNFYEKFVMYEYILVCQLDVFIFEDRLDYYCELGYDYIGAPWLRGVKSYEGKGYKVCYVGNGGLSLRKTATMISLLKLNQPEKFFWEDYYIASFGDKINIPPVEIALDFAFEGDVKKALEINGKWPMGIHGWWRFDLKTVKEEIEKRGYDLSGIKDGEIDKKSTVLNYRELDKESDVINKLVKEFMPSLCNDIIVWGAGYYGDIIGWILKKSGIDNFVYFDKADRYHGKKKYDKQIYTIETAYTDIINNTWIICSEKYMEEMYNELLQLGVSENNIVSYMEILNFFHMKSWDFYEN